MKCLLKPALGLALSLAPFLAAQAATLGEQPPADTCLDERNASYAQGFAAGDANGYNRGYSVGFGAGTAQGIAKCVADPQSCGITLASCIPDATYGETEPNDNLVAADPLTLGVKFWGQNLSGSDQDWYYVTTTSANQNLLLTFSVPDWIANVDLTAGTPAVWNVTVRDSAGNIFAQFTTDVPGAVQGEVYASTYTVTLGLIGTYYVVIKPSDTTKSNAYSYGITAILQDSPLTSQQPIVNFGDTEVEPNDVPSKANPLATSVTMNGLINLTFNNVVKDGTTEVWAQGENDWFVYYSTGNETITLTFCSRKACTTGNWLVEVYDQASAQAWENGTPESSLTPLLAFNTDTAATEPETFELGLNDPGYYFIKINHKRLFTATCNEYRYLNTSGAFISGAAGICTCDTEDAADVSSTGSSCYIPQDACTAAKSTYMCKKSVNDCAPDIDPGCVCAKEVTVTAEDGTTTTSCETAVQYQAHCSCSLYGGVVEVPEGAYTSKYNFTLFGTKMPTNTYNTDAYQDFLNRQSIY